MATIEKLNERFARVMVGEIRYQASAIQDAISDELRRIGNDRAADAVQKLDLLAVMEATGRMPSEEDLIPPELRERMVELENKHKKAEEDLARALTLAEALQGSQGA